MASSILIVDDMPHNLEVVARILQSEGYETRVVHDGPSALELLSLEPVDLILLDVNMPGMDGFEVCERLKQRPGLGEIPVIFLTGMGDRASVLRGFEVGGADFVTKPFDVEELLARVKTHLKIKRLQQRVREQSSELSQLRREHKRDTANHLRDQSYIRLINAAMPLTQSDEVSDEAVQTLLGRLLGWLSGEYAVILRDDSEGNPKPLYHFGELTRFSGLDELELPHDGEWQSLIADRRVLFRRLSSRVGPACLLLLPVMVDTGVWGATAVVVTEQECRPDDELLAALEVVSRLLGCILSRYKSS